MKLTRRASFDSGNLSKFLLKIVTFVFPAVSFHPNCHFLAPLSEKSIINFNRMTTNLNQSLEYKFEY